ncbi:MAG TPA: biotin/lipoate A/B protein ligase family protein [Syntrophales bacterium]|nr:biotin/lipoate A/B protein ligase family protein [Syntrophales bacterium]
MSVKKPGLRSETSWRLLPFRVSHAGENMAIDEAVFRLNRLEGMPPTLRFFGWIPPAVSLGYFQRAYQEIDIDFCRREGIDIVRRPTGGKAVLHDQELTYSLVASVDHPLFAGSILETYRAISLCILEALKRLGLAPEMVSEGRSASGTLMEAYCFAAPSKYELLVGGRKICGSAQVRAGGIFLQHGSLLTDIDLIRAAAVMRIAAAGIASSTTTLREQLGRLIGIDEVARILRGAFEDVLGICLAETGLTDREEELTQELLARKYGTSRWNLEGKSSPGEHGEFSGGGLPS